MYIYIAMVYRSCVCCVYKCARVKLLGSPWKGRHYKREMMYPMYMIIIFIKSHECYQLLYTFQHIS